MLIGNRFRPWVVLGGTITDVTIHGVLTRVHEFTANGNLTIIGPQGFISPRDLAEGLLMEFFLVGGGGGGGAGSSAGYGGAGGPGGLKSGYLRAKPGVWPAVIGAKGNKAPTFNSTALGTNGGDTSLLGLTANGGGAAGGVNNGGPTISKGADGANGGESGNGNSGTGFAQATNVSVPPQGNNAINGSPGSLGGVIGVPIDWLGTTVYKAKILTVGNAAANSGDGGGRGDGSGNIYDGGSGYAAVRYPLI
jgi:hypothetical protein